MRQGVVKADIKKVIRIIFRLNKAKKIFILFAQTHPE